jgi:hypothetical protein
VSVGSKEYKTRANILRNHIKIDVNVLPPQWPEFSVGPECQATRRLCGIQMVDVPWTCEVVVRCDVTNLVRMTAWRGLKSGRCNVGPVFALRSSPLRRSTNRSMAPPTRRSSSGAARLESSCRQRISGGSYGHKPGGTGSCSSSLVANARHVRATYRRTLLTLLCICYGPLQVRN